MKTALYVLALIVTISSVLAFTDIVTTNEDWNVTIPNFYEDILIVNGSIGVASTGVTAGDFLWIVNAGTYGTVTKIDTNTNQIVGKYRTCPEGQGCDPSRTTVDSDGNVWVGNRAGNYRGVVKVAAFNTNCIDRNNDSIITTSNSSTALAWGVDECVVGFVATPGCDIRPLGVDLNNHVWAGSYSCNRVWEITNPDNVTSLTQPNTYTYYGIGGYGGAIDATGKFWFSQANAVGNRVGYIDTNTKVIKTLSVSGGSYYGAASYQNYGILANTNSGFTVFTTDGNGNIVVVKRVTGGSYSRGISVHSTRNEVWFANWNDGWVYKYPIMPGPWTTSSASNVVSTGANVLGVVVDSGGFIWATGYNNGVIYKINPNNNSIVASVTGVPAPYTYSDATGSNLFQYIITGSWAKVTYDTQNYEWGVLNWTERNNQGGIGSTSNIKAYIKQQGRNRIRVYDGAEFELDERDASGDGVQLYFDIRTNPDLSSPWVDDYTLCITDFKCQLHAACVNNTRECVTVYDSSACGIDNRAPDPSVFDISCTSGGGPGGGNPPPDESYCPPNTIFWNGDCIALCVDADNNGQCDDPTCDDLNYDSICDIVICDDTDFNGVCDNPYIEPPPLNWTEPEEDENRTESFSFNKYRWYMIEPAGSKYYEDLRARNHANTSIRLSFKIDEALTSPEAKKWVTFRFGEKWYNEIGAVYLPAPTIFNIYKWIPFEVDIPKEAEPKTYAVVYNVCDNYKYCRKLSYVVNTGSDTLWNDLRYWLDKPFIDWTITFCLNPFQACLKPIVWHIKLTRGQALLAGSLLLFILSRIRNRIIANAVRKKKWTGN